MNETIYLAILKERDRTVIVEYRPLADGYIDILSIDILARPRSEWERRQENRRHSRQGLSAVTQVLNEDEQRAEAMQPYTWVEK